MMNEKHAITEAELQAFVDGRLALDRRAALDAYLADAPDELLRVQAYHRQNEALRARFNPVLKELIPAHLTEAAERPKVKPPTFMQSSLLRIAAAVAWLTLGVAAGWFWRDSSARSELTGAARAPVLQAVSFARGAALAHATYVPEKRHAVEVAADQEEHLVNWLSKRLGKPVRIPALTEQGYALVGGRMLPGETGPAAQFMYEDPRGARLTLYVKTEAKSSDTAFRYAEEKGVSVFYWVDGEFGYALSGTLEKSRLLEIANVVFHAIKPK